jgi:hypothetical protein
MSFRERLDKERRLVILQLLAAMDGRQASSRALKIGVDAVIYQVGRDIIEADLELLQQHSLVTIEPIKLPDNTDLIMAKLTEFGKEVSEGRSHPAVARPI